MVVLISRPWGYVAPGLLRDKEDMVEGAGFLRFAPRGYAPTRQVIIQIKLRGKNLIHERFSSALNSR